MSKCERKIRFAQPGKQVCHVYRSVCVGLIDRCSVGASEPASKPNDRRQRHSGLDSTSL